MKAELIADLGDEVYCDSCNEDSQEIGGILFGSNAYCPECSKRIMKDIEKYNEQDHIKATAGINETFHDFVIRIRNGNNLVVMFTE